MSSKPTEPDWNYVLDTVLPRLGMFTGNATFERAVCFVIGFDTARGGNLHPLLQDWAASQYGPTNLGWPWVIVRLTLGIPREDHKGRDMSGLDPEDDSAATDLLATAIRSVLDQS